MWQWLASHIPISWLVWFYKQMIMIGKSILLACTEYKWIKRAVQLIDAKIEKGGLLQLEPKLVFTFTGISGAISVIEFVRVTGRVSFETEQLSGEIEVKMATPPKIASFDRFQFSLIQRISRETAERVLASPHPDSSYHIRFDFSAVKIVFKRCFKNSEFELQLPKYIVIQGKEIWTTHPLLATIEYPPPATQSPALQ